VSASGHPATYMGSLICCRESLLRVVIPHHPDAMTTNKTEPSANNLATIGSRWWLLWLAWKLPLLSRVALMPRRGTHSDELAMNQGITHSIKGLFTRVRGETV
jgi:hypothetical protein